MATVNPVARRYSDNVNKALAAATPQAGGDITGCPACNKAGLPILLVRPGLADVDYAATQAGAISSLLKGTADSVELPTSGYVARTLREGFVHVYYENPQSSEIKQNNGWQIFRVSNGGYLTPYPIVKPPMTVAPKKDDAFACSRTANYGTAMLLAIPEPERQGNVWIGFADYPWSAPVRDNYAGNQDARDKRMTCVDAKAASCQASVKLTQSFLTESIVDYAAPAVRRSQLHGNPYQARAARPESVNTLIDRAEWIIEQGRGSDLSVDNALVVGLADPIGVTTEAAVRRVSLTQSASQWVARHEDGQWKLQTAQAIQKMLDRIDNNETVLLDSLEKYRHLDGHYVDAREFQQQKMDGELPPQATYERAERGNIGRVRIPTKTQVDAAATDRKHDVIDQLDQSWSTFLDRYNQKKDADKTRRVALDKDHAAWLQSDLRRLVTKHDYDTATPADGAYYATTVANITCFGPQTTISEASFATILDADPTDTDNLLMRALLGNQQSHFEWITAPEQQESEYKALASLLALPQMEGHSGAALNTAKLGLVSAAHPLLGVLGATAFVMNKQQSDSPLLRVRTQRLAGAVAGHAQGDNPPALLEIHLPLSELMAAWRAQRNQFLNTLQEIHGGARMHVAAGAIALALNAHPSAAEKMVRAWLWTHEKPEDIQRMFGAAHNATNSQVLRPAFSNLNRAWANAAPIRIDRAQVSSLFKKSLTAAGSTDGLLATSVAFYDLYSLIEGLDTLDTLTGQEREKALFKLSATALNVAGGALDVSGRVSQAWAKRASKNAGEAALKEAGMAGGRLIAGGSGLFAVAAAIAAVESAMSAYSAYEKADVDEVFAQLTMAFAQGASFGALGSVAFGTWQGAIAGTSAFGAGLISAEVAAAMVATGGLAALGLVIVIFAVGYWAAAAKDDAIANWAKRCIWGNAGVEHYGTQKAETFALNKVFLLLTCTFHIRTDPGSVSAMPAGPDRRRQQAKLTLQFPNSEDQVWGYVISGLDASGQRVRLADHRHGPLVFDNEWPAAAPVVDSGSINPDNDDKTYRHTVAFPHGTIKNLKATVMAYASKSATQPLYRQTIEADHVTFGY